MKVVTPKQMSAIESQAYKDGASDSEFMEEAGSGIALIVQDFIERNNLDRTVILLCGKGNNGGDAYVTGIHLVHLDYEVYCIQAEPIAESSPLCKQNYERFINEGGKQAETLNEFPVNGLIVDGLFGTGFKGAVSDPYLSLIALANHSGLPIISVDIPSGLDGETGVVEGEAIIATETAFLGLPKTGFFLNDGWDHTGKLRYVDFGLSKQYFEPVQTEMIMLTDEILKPLMPVIRRSRHKYEAGFVVGIAGSPAMPGAAILSSSAALRSGAGIVRLFYPEGMEAQLAACPYELIHTPFKPGNLDGIIAELQRATAVFIGPGLGKTAQTVSLLRNLLPRIDKPCVIDADALNILAEEGISLPNDTIMTPHHGEMARLLKMKGKPVLNAAFIAQCREYADKTNVTLVLKGAPTYILHASYPVTVNPTGDPGMATAGSGDVLTGLIAGLLAQGMTCQNAAALGVYLHGLAGEHAAEDLTSYGMCASDIIYRFPEAFKFIDI